jgi:hypothetical protein
MSRNPVVTQQTLNAESESESLFRGCPGIHSGEDVTRGRW